MILTESDRVRLAALLKNSNGPLALGTARRQLRDLLHEAHVVSAAEVPATTVTMNSVIGVIDLVNGRTASYVLVYPPEANVDLGRLSVLTPLGAALLGRSEREVVEVESPAGMRRYYIQEILYQPESAIRGTTGPPAAA